MLPAGPQPDPLLQLTLGVFSFVLGGCVGSFLNVVIYRLPRNISVARPRRSFCPACEYQIPGWLNIPLVSWLLLRGRCSNCQAAISPRYFFVELLTAMLFLLTFLWFRYEPWKVMPLWIFLSLCVAATYIDFDHLIIPDQITYGGTVAGIACSVIFPWMIEPGAPRWVNLAHSVLGAAAGLGLVWLVVQFGKLAFGRLKYSFPEPAPFEIHQPEGEPEPVVRIGGASHLWMDVFSRPTDRLRILCQSCRINDEEMGEGELFLREEEVEWQPRSGETLRRPLEEVQRMSGTTTFAMVPREAMGLGDVKFMGLIGAFLGWKGIVFTLVAASIIGSLVALLTILLRRREWAARLPFGPYLALGGALWVFIGPAVVAWYLDFGRFNE